MIGRALRYLLGKLRSSLFLTATKLIPPRLAEKLLLRRLLSDEEYWPFTNIHMIHEIEKRLNTLEDPEGANRYLHHRWVMILNKTFDDLRASNSQIPPNFHYLCLGAGQKNTFALPFLFHMAGAGKVYIVEPQKDIQHYSVFYGLQDMMLRLCLGRLDSDYFVKTPDVHERIKAFLNPEGFFERRDIFQVLNPQSAVFYNEYFEDAKIPENSIDLLTSRSALEHVSDYEGCFARFSKVMKKGGVMYHEIGLGGHSAKDPFHHYYLKSRESDKDPYGLNGLRVNDYIEAFTDGGFQCTVVDKTVLHDYTIDRTRILERYRQYSDENLRCENVVLVCRKS